MLSNSHTLSDIHMTANSLSYSFMNPDIHITLHTTMTMHTHLTSHTDRVLHAAQLCTLTL